MQDISKYIVDIEERHRSLGILAREAIDCYDGEMYMSAITNLFIVTEYICKFVNDENSGNFKQSIDKAFIGEFITLDEKDLLNLVRQLRNKMFHESHEMYAIVIDGKAWMFSDAETKQMIFESLSRQVYPILSRLMKSTDM